MVVGVKVVDIGGVDELMLDENGGRDMLSIDDVEREGNDIVAEAFREVTDRTDQAAILAANFSARFGRCILADDDTLAGAACFFESSQRAESAGVVDGAHKNVFGFTEAEIAAGGFEAAAELAVAIEMNHADFAQVAKNFLHADEHTGHARRRERTGLGQFEQQHFVDEIFPMRASPAGGIAAADETGFVVIGAVESRAGVRDFDRDERNAGFAVFG